MKEEAPPEFEHVVQSLKDKFPDDPSRAFAIAWGMKNRGYKPKSESGKPYDAHAMYRRYQHECGKSEAMSASTMGQLMRKGVKEGPFGANPQATFAKEAQKPKSGRFGWVTPFREAVATKSGESAGVPKVVLISAGPGNLKDKNFYPPDVIERDCVVMEGKPAFFNHPGEYDSANRSEREVELIGGYFRNVHPEKIEGNTSAVADLVYLTDLSGQLTKGGKQMKELVEAAIRYKQDMPDSDGQLLGFSINASGGSEPTSGSKLIERYPQYRDKLQEADEWNAVTDIGDAFSTDIVTLPARGGRVLGLTQQHESRRWRIDFNKVIESKDWRESFRKKLAADSL